MPSKIGDCANPVPLESTGQLCGKVGVLVVTGPVSGLTVCTSCYQNERRAQEKAELHDLGGPFAEVDRHNPAIRREHEKIEAGYHMVVKGLAKMGCPAVELRQIQKILEPLLEPIKFMYRFTVNSNDQGVDSQPAYFELAETDESTVDSQPEPIPGESADISVPDAHGE
jgi:hypothetical protein